MGDTQKNLTVVFDFDGTIANTLDLIVRLYNQHAADFGAEPVSVSEFPKLRLLGYKKALKSKKLRWRMLPRLIIFIRREMKQHMAEVKPYDGIREMIEGLKLRGASVGILTSNDSGSVHDFLGSHDFPVFDFVVSERTVFSKEKALHKIMDRHGLDPERVIYVGDEPRDVTSSQKAGVKVIGVTWGIGGPESMETHKPDIVVQTVAELEEVLLSLV